MCCAEQPVGETCDADKSGCPPRIPTLLCDDHPTAVREGKFCFLRSKHFFIKNCSGHLRDKKNLSIKQNATNWKLKELEIICFHRLNFGKELNYSRPWKNIFQNVFTLQIASLPSFYHPIGCFPPDLMQSKKIQP